MKDMIKAFQKKDFKAFDAFYAMTSKQVFFTLKKYIQDPMLIEDLMQETYIKFIKNILNVNPDLEVKSYLTTMARNLAIDHLRKTKPHVYSDDILLNVLDNNQVDEDMLHLLDSLDKVDRDIIYLHVIEEMTFKDIGLLHDMPLGTVLWRYQKALKRLKKEYQNELER
jgi:RNA polymerase sigma-70 factor (ECF subfamily)